MSGNFLGDVGKDIKFHFKLFGCVVLFAGLAFIIFSFLPEDLQKNIGNDLKTFGSKAEPYMKLWRSYNPKIIVGTLIFNIYFSLCLPLCDSIFRTEAASKKLSLPARLSVIISSLGVVGAGVYYSIDLPPVAWAVHLFEFALG